ncbi:amidase family protein [Paraburkholderia kururiensis]|uniref:Amidase family protein n=1 Tax=Paraburkholderia kururiensis TaxID=984307 RepID=A0ABZ0WIF2_9BURK|nr:amidase family protein [Paraburkholderia kururiensis]WQD77106.1 amidase family protein [Paraburkholderia kururiensis]
MQQKIEANSTAKTDALASLGVVAAVEAIRKGEVSSESYASALLQRARDHADLNSFVTIDEAAVLEAARKADKTVASGTIAPLRGVPVAIKDSYLTEGLRSTIGLSILDSFVPEHDADAVQAIKDGGGIIFGKNNLVEMSFGLTGHNEAYGQAKNPHNTNHVSGGSSGGGGVSVAARLVPAALGGDTIGSIRVPASLCGVVGFKPTTGRWPRSGVAPISHTLDTTGVFARNVEDCILIDRVVTRDETPDSRTHSGLKGVTLACAPRQFLERVAPEVDARFKETIRQLRDAGANVVEVDLGEDFSGRALTATWNIFFREAKAAVEKFIRQNNVPATFDAILDSLKPGLKNVWTQFVLPTGQGYISDEVYRHAVWVERAEIKRRYAEAFSSTGAEALILPTTPSVAPMIGQEDKIMLGGQETSQLVLANNTIPASAAGLPGISLPIGASDKGLPIGLELDGPFGRDRALLYVARRVEAVVGTLPAPI